MSSDPPHVIVQIATPQGVACDGYYDLPVTLPAYIALVTDGSALADREAAGVRFELRRQILSLPGARLEMVELPCGACPAYRSEFDCTAIDRGRSRNVLVFIGNGSSGPSPSPPVVAASRNTSVLVMLPRGAKVPPIPWATPTTNVGYWQGHATEVVPQIFASAGLTEPDARVFISYRREESGELAEQLFTELGKRNFDVFVDRFRIQVGADFQQRILQELAHKSMAVVLESKTMGAARWTRYEIAVAKSSRIGILAIHLPNGRRIPDIDDSRREHVQLRAGRLDDADLARVVDRIVAEHGLSQLRRRRLLRENMQRSLQLAGVHRQTVVDGAIFVEPNDPPPRRYFVWLPSRPAELRDFHFVATTATPSPAARTIVAPAAHFVGSDRQRVRWLADTAGVRSFDEGNMLQVARAMKGETL